MRREEEVRKEPYPLWLPRGSVRAILALGSILATIIMIFVGIEVPEWWYAVVAAISAYYFGQRSVEPPR